MFWWTSLNGSDKFHQCIHRSIDTILSNRMFIYYRPINIVRLYIGIEKYHSRYYYITSCLNCHPIQFYPCHSALVVSGAPDLINVANTKLKKFGLMNSLLNKLIFSVLAWFFTNLIRTHCQKWTKFGYCFQGNYRRSEAKNVGSVCFMVREKIGLQTDGQTDRHGEYISVFYPIGKKR